MKKKKSEILGGPGEGGPAEGGPTEGGPAEGGLGEGGLGEGSPAEGGLGQKKHEKHQEKTGTNTKDNKKEQRAKRVPHPETAQKIDFFTRNVTRNREANEEEKNQILSPRAKKKKDRKKKPQKGIPPRDGPKNCFFSFC